MPAPLSKPDHGRSSPSPRELLRRLQSPPAPVGSSPRESSILQIPMPPPSKPAKSRSNSKSTNRRLLRPVRPQRPTSEPPSSGIGNRAAGVGAALRLRYPGKRPERPPDGPRPPTLRPRPRFSPPMTAELHSEESKTVLPEISSAREHQGTIGSSEGA